jgi:hypothetical protein
VVAGAVALAVVAAAPVVGASGMTAAAAPSAEVSFSSPITVVRAEGEHAEILLQADPIQGAWGVLSSLSQEKLIRINEDGSAEAVPLPRELAYGGLFRFTPLKDGWAVATAVTFPGGRREEHECSGVAPEGRCGELVVAQRSPGGHWTRVRRLPNSPVSGFEEEPVKVIETGGVIEVAWREYGQYWIAAARPGGAFGRPHAIPPPAKGAEALSLETFRGKFYLRAFIGGHGSGHSDHVVERQIYASGRLGPAHFLTSRVLEDAGLEFGPLAGGGGSEVFLYFGVGAQSGDDFVTHRVGWASTFERSHLIASDTSCCVHTAEASDDWLLITTEARIDGLWQLVAAELSPTGRFESTQTVENTQLKSVTGEVKYDWGGEIDNAGQVLIFSSPNADQEEEWIEASAPGCREFSRIPHAKERPSGDFVAGPHNVFHFAWINTAHEVEMKTAHVQCTTK